MAVLYASTYTIQGLLTTWKLGKKLKITYIYKKSIKIVPNSRKFEEEKRLDNKCVTIRKETISNLVKNNESMVRNERQRNKKLKTHV